MRRKHTVTFEGGCEVHALALAKLGQSTSQIIQATGLSPSQVTYRLNKAKRLENRDHGYRVGWRNGESPVIKRIKRDMMAVLKMEIARDLPRKIKAIQLGRKS